MDQATLLLVLVVAVVAASQLLQHSGTWILKPWVFWPVQVMLVVLIGFVFAASFEDLMVQVRPAIRGFLTLFVGWRLVMNWKQRGRVQAILDEERKWAAVRKGRLEGEGEVEVEVEGEGGGEGA
jgi:hypothetical protein